MMRDHRINLKRFITVVLTVCIMMSSSPLHPAEAAVEQDLHGRVVILDAGHGEGDSPGYAGYVEHVAMLKLAKKIKPLLEARGATVVLTRETDYNTPLHVRGGLINKLALETVKASKQQALLSAAPNARRTFCKRIYWSLTGCWPSFKTSSTTPRHTRLYT